jgi:hypothetical protein
VIRFLSITALALLALAPYPALSQSDTMSTSIGVGPNGYDFVIGTWTCTNSMPSSMAGPATTTLTMTRSAQASLMFHSTGTNYDATGYVAYNPNTKTWSNPSALGDGSYENESTKQTGPKSTWAGIFYDASKRTTSRVRDKYTFSSTTFTDIGQAQSGGGWKTISKTTCTKT